MHGIHGAIPSYEESTAPTLPGLFLRTDQLDAVCQVRNWHSPRPVPGEPFNGSAGTGVLIGPRLVLTAKHVVAERSAGDYRRRANAVPAANLDVVFDKTTFGDDLPVGKIVGAFAVEVINPGVALELGTIHRDTPIVELLRIESADLALILLERQAPASPIPIGSFAPSIGDRLQLAGFGQMAIGRNERGWAVGTVSHLSDDESGFMVRAAGSSESDTSPGPGDSGGPAIAATASGAGRVVGIVSGGRWLFPEMERTRQELYVNVDHYRTWISEASSRLLAEDWQHDRDVGGGATGSTLIPLVVGGIAALFIAVLLSRK